MAYGNPHNRGSNKYGSSQARTASRISRYGGKTAGDKGTRRAGRMESRMQLMRKHRARRRTARKESSLYTPAEAGKMKSQMKAGQRHKRRAMFKSQGILNRRTVQRAPLRTRATERGTFKRALPAAGRGQPQRASYGGEQQSSRRREQMREALKDY